MHFPTETNQGVHPSEALYRAVPWSGTWTPKWTKEPPKEDLFPSLNSRKFHCYCWDSIVTFLRY